MFADDDTRDTKTGDDEAGSDDAGSDTDDSSTDDTGKDASGGDVAGGKDGEDTDEKGGRAGKRISELVTTNKKLAQKNEDLETRLDALETALAKGGAPESKQEAKSDENPAIAKLRKMGYTDEQIEAAKLVYQSVAGQTDSELKKEVEALRHEIASNKEKEALNEAIISAKKDGIEVTPKQIAEFRKSCMNSSDPRERLLAEAPYPRIIKMMLMDGVIEKKGNADTTEDDSEEEKPKRKPEPKIPGGKDSRIEKKPSGKGFKYDPGNAMGSMEALERRVLSRVGADDEE